MVSSAENPIPNNNLNNLDVSDELSIKHADKVEEVRNEMVKLGEDPLESLVMIDTVQRLGIEYYFQEEIDTILKRHYEDLNFFAEYGHDLYQVALRFRLLRQQNFYVKADVFNSFMDKEGNFKQEIEEDVFGLMGFYEASQLSIEGEDELDESGQICMNHLQAYSVHLDQHQATIVLNALAHPYHKILPKFTATSFTKTLQGTNGWVNAAKELAILDLNIIKPIYQKEALQVSKWWKDIGLARELNFARNQPLKWYMWAMAVLTDPCLSEQRVELTKPISLVYVIDDIFYLYGTLGELALLTEAVNRWDLAETEKLPEYMKTCFKILYEVTNQISSKIHKDHGWNPINSLKSAWARLCNAFLVEAKWFASGKMAKADEYLKNGIISCGVHVVLVHIFFLLGHGITDERVHLLDHVPPIVSSVATVLRLWDDLGSAKDENQDGQDGSYINCLMKENANLSEENARKHVMKMISETWKCLNQECIISKAFPISFSRVCLNAVRMVPLMYNYNQNHSLPTLQDHMKSMLYGL